jgi:SAM-dependent methyltransferase
MEPHVLPDMIALFTGDISRFMRRNRACLKSRVEFVGMGRRLAIELTRGWVRDIEGSMSIDLQQLRGFISAMYTDVARYPRGDFHFPTGRPLMEQLGYDSGLLDRIPTTALESYAGVGHHFGLAPLEPGEHVLDLGCGAGSDAFHAALQVAPGGKVIGIDMTDSMLEKCETSRQAGGFDNVEFQKAQIEELPFEDSSFDCVISNGVINLTPLKSAVFQGVARVLKRGGRLMFSDIVTGAELPESVRENCELWAECIGGAEEQQRYLKGIEECGLSVDTVVENPYRFTEGSTLKAATKFQVKSISILARRRE